MRRVIGLLVLVCALALAASAAAAKPSLQVGQLQLSGSALKVSLSCQGAPCKGTMTLTKTGAKKSSPKVVLAQAPYSVPSGRTKSVTVKLTAKGTSLLNAILHGKAKPTPATLTATVTGGATQTQSVKFP
jgi:hypothetical protein